MPKIRKKTSNRSTTRMREKVKHKVKEAHKKAKKAAKKDITWKTRVKKDLGIPSLFPYKDQLLVEQQQAKVQQAAERQSAQSSVLALASQINLQSSAEMDLDDLGNQEEGESMNIPDDPCLSSSASIKTHAKSLQKVLELSDVLIEVLDARDPIGTRSFQLERDSVRQGKKLILVLNKVDLVPRENVEGWLKYLRRSWPTLPFKSSTQSQKSNLSSKGPEISSREGGSNSNACSIQPLMHLLKNYSRYSAIHSAGEPGGSAKVSNSTHTIKSLASITVGVIGFPNVGKSSLINTLKRSRACGVAPTPGFTKDVKEIVLEKGLKVLDCPGVVLEFNKNLDSRSSAGLVLRNAIKVEQIIDPLPPISLILERCKPEHLMLLYNIPAFSFPGQTEDSQTKEFLIQVARSRGRVKKGGIPDLEGCARGILRDWNMGRIPYYTVPPDLSNNFGKHKETYTDSEDLGQATILKELGDEFDLESIFKRADHETLGELKSKKEIGKVVRMRSTTETDHQDENQLILMGENLEEDVEMTDETEDLKKRKKLVKIDNEPKVISILPKTNKKAKTVVINSETEELLPPLQQQIKITNRSSQLQRMGIEQSILGENRQILKQAKKDRKKSIKQQQKLLKSKSQGEEEVNQVDDDEIEMKDQDDASSTQIYSFAEFFSK